MNYYVVIDKDFEELVATFLKGRLEDIFFLKESLKKRDFEKISYIGHKIKGAAYNYGFDVIGDIGEKIENYSLTEDGDNIKSLVDMLEDYLKNINIGYEEM